MTKGRKIYEKEQREEKDMKNNEGKKKLERKWERINK